MINSGVPVHHINPIIFEAVGREDESQPEWYFGEVYCGVEIVFTMQHLRSLYPDGLEDFTGCVERAFARRLYGQLMTASLDD